MDVNLLKWLFEERRVGVKLLLALILGVVMGWQIGSAIQNERIAALEARLEGMNEQPQKPAIWGP